MLAEGLTRSRESGLQTVVLSGEAGIGKTTLLGAFAGEVRDGARRDRVVRAL